MLLFSLSLILRTCTCHYQFSHRSLLRSVAPPFFVMSMSIRFCLNVKEDGKGHWNTATKLVHHKLLSSVEWQSVIKYWLATVFLSRAVMLHHVGMPFHYAQKMSSCFLSSCVFFASGKPTVKWSSCFNSSSACVCQFMMCRRLKKRGKEIGYLPKKVRWEIPLHLHAIGFQATGYYGC